MIFAMSFGASGAGAGATSSIPDLLLAHGSAEPHPATMVGSRSPAGYELPAGGSESWACGGAASVNGAPDTARGRSRERA